MKYKNMNICIGAFVLIALFLTGGYFLVESFFEVDYSNLEVSDRAVIRLATANELLDSIVFIARDKSFFDEEDIDVRITEYASGKLALQAMFAGEVDVSPVAEVPVVFNSFKWDDFSVVSTIGAADKHMTIVGRRDLGIESPEDLKGKRLATQKSSALHYFSSVFLKENGLSESDVDISYLHITKLSSALVSGEVDAVAVIEPFASELREELGDNGVFFTPSGVYEKTWSLLAFNEFIYSNPEVVLKFVRALVSAEEFLENNREESVAIIAENMNIEESVVLDNLDRLGLQVSMDEWYRVLLEDVALWAIETELIENESVPDYSNYLYRKALIDAKTSLGLNEGGY